MPRNTRNQPRFKKALLALATGAVLVPHGVWALDLAQAPPGSTEPYVAPNVIISVDDSGSMDWKITNTDTGSATITTPKADGSWDINAKRINILRHSLKKVFNDTSLLPDKKIRVAWQTMWNNGSSPNAKSVDSTTMNQNSMRVLQGSHRTNFTNFVDNLKASNGTPSHLMFQQADAYMRRGLSDNSPWAAVPGTTGAPFLGCRRNYHIMMTDGRWNGSVSGDSKDDNTENKSLPDGTVYGSATPATRPNTKLYHDTYSNTLADWAFYSWAEPLQSSGLTGTVQPTSDYRQAAVSEDFGTASSPAVLERFWNPRYNPATWPHMVTYTIGFSTDATTWPGANTIVAPTEQVPFGYDGSFPSLVNGTRTWPNVGGNADIRALDLWHAALNGRGRFYAVMKGDDLEKAFRQILGKINTQTEPDLGSNATSGSNNTRFEVGKYVAGYEPKNAWKGLVTAESVKTDGTTVPAAGWEGKSTADRLDDPAFSVANRLVLSWSDKWDTSKYKGGVPFKWAADDSKLSTAQKLWLQKSTGGGDEGATKGEQRLDFIRGDTSLQGSDTTGYTPAKPLRERKSRQGDIINSVVWYVGVPASSYPLKGYAAFTRSNRSRTPMIYVGGNDGMLHGFSTADGSEKMAYVPKGVIPALTYLTTPGYNNKHKYFVDGSAMTGDVDMGTGVQDPADSTYDPNYAPSWRTLLVGTLGAGGKGYFALDVTNPTASDIPAPASVPGFVESNAQQLVKLDRTRNVIESAPDCTLAAMSAAEKTACLTAKDEDDDIGHITAQPVLDDANPMHTTQITRLNNNRWAAVMGNGYNSANKRPVLLIQYLDGDKELLRIPVTGAGYATDNGLAAPRLVDLNGDGRPDVVYAGDNFGNLWKFDITNLDSADWKIAFGGSPLFTAAGPASLGSALRPKVQPITATPTVRANDRTKTVGTGAAAKTSAVGGMMVAFGTGRNIAQTDPESVDVQTLYSVLDNTHYRVITPDSNKPQVKRLEVHPGEACSGAPTLPPCLPTPVPQALGSGVALLTQQSVGAEESGSGINAGRKFSTTSASSVDWVTQKGWYLDLPAVGERLLKSIGFFDGTNLLTVYSQVPAKGSDVDPNIESCDSTSVDEERQYLTLVNIMDGKRPSVQLMDMNGDGAYSLAAGKDKGVSRVSLSKGSHTLITQGKKIVDLDAKNNKLGFARMPEQSLRPSWRQLR